MKRNEFRQRNLARSTKNFLEYSPKSDTLKEKYFECQELFVARLVACAVPVIICTNTHDYGALNCIWKNLRECLLIIYNKVESQII